MESNNSFKIFLKGGLYGMFFLIIYEISLLILSPIIGIFTIVLSWLPFYFTAVIFESIFLMFFVTFLLFFIIGGLINLLIKKFKR